MYSVEWEELPMEFQKYLVIILPLLQKPRILTGYGILQCNWLTFASVFISGVTMMSSLNMLFAKEWLMMNSCIFSFFSGSQGYCLIYTSAETICLNKFSRKTHFIADFKNTFEPELGCVRLTFLLTNNNIYSQKHLANYVKWLHNNKNHLPKA